MLPRKNRLKNKKDFNRIYQSGNFYQNKFIALKFSKNDLSESRIGIVVGTKISKKAVERNRVKRRIRASILGFISHLISGYDVVIMVRPEIVEKDFAAIDTALTELFYKAKLLRKSNG